MCKPREHGDHDFDQYRDDVATGDRAPLPGDEHLAPTTKREYTKARCSHCGEHFNEIDMNEYVYDDIMLCDDCHTIEQVKLEAAAIEARNAARPDEHENSLGYTIIYTSKHCGCWADGAHGHEFTRETLADLVESLCRGGHEDKEDHEELLASLHGDTWPDDLTDEDEAREVLRRHTDDSLIWEFVDGDLMLNPFAPDDVPEKPPECPKCHTISWDVSDGWDAEADSNPCGVCGAPIANPDKDNVTDDDREKCSGADEENTPTVLCAACGAEVVDVMRVEAITRYCEDCFCRLCLPSGEKIVRHVPMCCLISLHLGAVAVAHRVQTITGRAHAESALLTDVHGAVRAVVLAVEQGLVDAVLLPSSLLDTTAFEIDWYDAVVNHLMFCARAFMNDIGETEQDREEVRSMAYAISKMIESTGDIK